MDMKNLFGRGIALVVAALASATSALAADPFPAKPIRLVVASAAGGSLDVTARLVAKGMSEKLGQPVVVENLVGAGSLIAIRTVKAAPADGYTLLAAVNTVLIQQALSNDPGYDVGKDFVGVGPMTRSPFVLVTASSQPDKNVTDLLARAKANPGKLTYASAGIGSTTLLAAALFAQQAGAHLTHIPYKGNAAAWPDLIAGRVDLLFEGTGGAIAMTREGRLKALGITSSKRLEALPNVPTIAEQGVPNYSFYFWVGLLAPSATPKDVLQTLSTAMRSALSSTELKNRFRDEGAEIMSMSPEEFTQFLKSESTAVTKLVSELNLPKQ
jgi:tripartite-type tricarboxylate transporter receptor subunit TctC